MLGNVRVSGQECRNNEEKDQKAEDRKLGLDTFDQSLMKAQFFICAIIYDSQGTEDPHENTLNHDRHDPNVLKYLCAVERVLKFRMILIIIKV